MAERTVIFAFDRANRTQDVDGRLHVARSNICMATVSPYKGAEIPNWEELELDPDRIYQLFRPPEELEKAFATANNIQLLAKHVPVSVDEPMHELVVGSTGTDAAWEPPYITNSLVIWDAEAIHGIESREQVELSPAYRYVAEKKSGSYQGLTYDLTMTNLAFNHVALVEEGRQGPTVVVADSKLGMPPMALKTRKALMVKGALSAYLVPKLAQDAKIDLTTILADVSRKNFAAKAPGLITAITAACKGKLAQDADLADLAAVIDTFKGEGMEDGAADEDDIPDEEDDEEKEVAVDGDDVASKVMAFLKGKISDEDLAQIASLCGPGGQDQEMDVNEPDDATKGPKTAMDAKIIQARAVRQVAVITQAREDVEPIVGKVSLALDSAAAIYGLAFDHLGITYKGIPAAAYPAMLKLAKDAHGSKPVIAQDAADGDAVSRFSKNFPDAAPLARS